MAVGDFEAEAFRGRTAILTKTDGEGRTFDSQDLVRNAWTRAGHDCVLSQWTIWNIIITGTTWLINGCCRITFTTPDADILRVVGRRIQILESNGANRLE